MPRESFWNSHLAEIPIGQLNDIRNGVAQTAAEKLRVQPDDSGRTGILRAMDGRILLNEVSFSRVNSIVWDLIIEGVLRPGTPDGNSHSLPHYHVTEFGREHIKDPTTPYDPDNYLRTLRTAIPGLEPVILTYLNESLHTFRINCLLSSTVTLGCASEKAFLILVRAYGDALSGPQQAKFRQSTEGKLLKRQFDEFTKYLNSHLRAKLPSDIEADLDVTLVGIFTLFRNLRNEAGHPTGKTVSREQAYASLVVFPTYLTKIYQLIEWLSRNPL